MAGKKESKSKKTAGKKPTAAKMGSKPKKTAVKKAVEPVDDSRPELQDSHEEETVEPDPGSASDDRPDSGVEEESSEKGLVYVGALSRYLAEVRRHPLLSREEEYDLAVRLFENSDQEAAATLVTSNLRLVVKIAMEYQRAFINVLDLIQEGNIGLMQAVARFNPYKGVKLSSYASWWIKAYILRYILNNWRMVKVVTTQTQRKLFFNLQKEKEKLEAMGISPTPMLLASNLDVLEKDVIEMDKRLSQGELSIDLPLGDDSRSSLGDLVADSDKLQDDTLADAQMAKIHHRKLKEFESLLSDKERFIYSRRMLAEEPLTLQEIGEYFGITRERVRQIENRILLNLRKFFEEEGLKGP